MRLGNVLVHCEKGQRRSPTVFLCWLMYHGFSLITSIDMIANEYEGDEDWGESYKRRRNLWIDGPLDIWQSKCKTICKKWIMNSNNKATMREWKEGCSPKNITNSICKKRKRILNADKDENEPPTKIQKITE